MNLNIVIEHLFIVAASALLSVIIGIPLGIIAYLYSGVRKIILAVVDILQTIPALALLGIIMVFAGAGRFTVIIGITLYSLLPIVRNTYLGLEQIPAGIKEAATGMGMSKTYRLMHIGLPLAFPMIFTGIRIAVVSAIGTAVFAAFVGGGGIGAILNRGIRIQDMSMILNGTLILMLIAIALDLLMGFFERKIKKLHGSIRLMAYAGIASVVFFVAMLPFAFTDKAVANEVVMYDGDYSETKIMHYMAKALIEDKTDFDVVIKDQMSQVNNFKALIGNNHSCDMMISYDGTLLTTFLHLDTVDVPEGMSIYDFANNTAIDRHKIRLMGKLGFDNTYAIAVPMKIAQKYKLENVSDLLPVAKDLVFGAEHEFFTQEGSMKFIPFVNFYGLEFKDNTSVDVSLKYAAIENNSFDVTEVFATDGLNRKANLKVLHDDKEFFPDYNGCFLIREDLEERFKVKGYDINEVLGVADGKISNEDMVDMTYKVDVEGKSVKDVVMEFLNDRGIISN